jgi:hypothetical protein
MAITGTHLGVVFRAIQTGCGGDDNATVEAFGRLLDGFCALGEERYLAECEAEMCILVNRCVAIAKDKKSKILNGILFDRGVKAVIYIDGNNIGIVRRGDITVRMDDPRIREVVTKYDDINEWFAHTAGFLFCRGSRKAPAQNPSSVPVEELASAVAAIVD